MLAAVRGGGVKPDVAAFLTVLAAVRGGGTNLYVEPSSCAELLRCRVMSVHWPALSTPSLGGALGCAPSTPFTDLCLAGTCLPTALLPSASLDGALQIVSLAWSWRQHVLP